jgi:dsDNA-binding SOS-regulon protein
MSVVNARDIPIVLQPGKEIGVCKSSYEEIDCEMHYCAQVQEKSDTSDKDSPLADHLHELLHRNSEHLNPDQSRNLALLLKKYKKIYLFPRQMT